MRSQFVSPVCLPSLSRVGWRFAASSAGAWTSICVSILFFCASLGFRCASLACRAWVRTRGTLHRLQASASLGVLLFCSLGLCEPSKLPGPLQRGLRSMLAYQRVAGWQRQTFRAQDLCAEAMPSSLHSSLVKRHPRSAVGRAGNQTGARATTLGLKLGSPVRATGDTAGTDLLDWF